MRNADELRNAVDRYMERRGCAKKKSYFDPYNMIYQVTTMDYTEIDGKIITDINGRERVVFKIDGKIANIKK